MSPTRLIARPLLASVFAVGAINALKNAPQLAPAAEPVTEKIVPAAQKVAPQVPIPEDPTTLVRINAGVQLVAAGALATGKLPRLSSAVLAASLVPTTLAGHRFWEHEAGPERTQHQLHFFKNASIVGGLLIASGDTEGRPGVAWRARHAAKDARREAARLAATTKREAKLAKAQLT